MAKKYKKWILIGSLIIKNKKKLFNRSVLIDDKGKIKTFYDKIHMYDAKLSKSEKYYESKTFKAGKISQPSETINVEIPASMVGSDALGSYSRTTPARYTQERDDRLMNSLINNYAREIVQDGKQTG